MADKGSKTSKADALADEVRAAVEGNPQWQEGFKALLAADATVKQAADICGQHLADYSVSIGSWPTARTRYSRALADYVTDSGQYGDDDERIKAVKRLRGLVIYRAEAFLTSKDSKTRKAVGFAPKEGKAGKADSKGKTVNVSKASLDDVLAAVAEGLARLVSESDSLTPKQWQGDALTSIINSAAILAAQQQDAAGKAA